jgi:tetratricopeptide (TPR) repeat protein
MFKGGYKPIVLVGIGLGLIVLFLLLPRQPWGTQAKPAMENAGPVEKTKIEQAIELVNGPNPMAGITMLRDMVAQDSTNVDAHYQLGVFAVKSGQLDKAILRFNKVIQLEPDYIGAYIDLGGVYQAMNQLDKALEYYEKAAVRDSTSNYALLFAGQSAERLGDNKKAVDYYRQLLRHTRDTVVTVRVKEMIERIEKK